LIGAGSSCVDSDRKSELTIHFLTRRPDPSESTLLQRLPNGKKTGKRLTISIT